MIVAPGKRSCRWRNLPDGKHPDVLSAEKKELYMQIIKVGKGQDALAGTYNILTFL